MIYPFNGYGPNATRLAFTYNGLTLNNPADPKDDTIECAVFAIDNQFDAVTEPKVTTHGMQGFHARKVVTVIQIDGVIRAPKSNFGRMMDRVMELNAAFDPVSAFISDSATTYNRGYLPFEFSIPTSDLINYPSGIITAQYYVRALKRPVARSSQFEGSDCRFTLLLQAIDPRCYFKEQQTASRSNAGAITVDNSPATFPSWPTVTFTITGGTSGKVSITHNGTDAVTKTINLSGTVATNVVVVDMERHLITLNGVVDMGMDVSGFWPELPPENTTWTIANVTGTLAATVEVAWKRAFV